MIEAIWAGRQLADVRGTGGQRWVRFITVSFRASAIGLVTVCAARTSAAIRRSPYTQAMTVRKVEAKLWGRA
jgi:hypothetical protein